MKRVRCLLVAAAALALLSGCAVQTAWETVDDVLPDTVSVWTEDAYRISFDVPEDAVVSAFSENGAATVYEQADGDYEITAQVLLSSDADGAIRRLSGFDPEQLEVLNVVNIRRPLAGTVEKIIDLQQQMEIHSHLKITGMINNTNLATMTTPAELRDGYEMLREVSDRTGVPVMYTTGKKEMLDIFLAEGHDPKYIGKPVPIDIIMKRDWDSYIHSLSEKKQA